MAVASLTSMDAVVGYLLNSGWYRELDLVVKGVIDRPVFTKEIKKKTYRVVVGPLWTTYYDIKNDIIGYQDSVKTDLHEVKAVIKEFTCG